MAIRVRMAAVVCAALAAAWAPSAVRAGVITKTATLPLTSTNFNTNNNSLSPLTFQQFDTQNGTLQLDEVDLTFHALVRNNFGMTFTTPATITATVGTGNPAVPGPTITMLQPDGKTPLITASAPNTAQALTRTVTYGMNAGEKLPQSFGSDQVVGSKFYIQPAITEASNSLKLTNASDLALFTGAGKLSLPVSAQAFAKITSSSGNGSGWVQTFGTADATVTYKYHDRVPAPEVVPEPATVMLWGVAGLAALGASRLRRRA
jgi:hypothetical protein